MAGSPSGDARFRGDKAVERSLDCVASSMGMIGEAAL
jgi:hypothetical protein